MTEGPNDVAPWPPWPAKRRTDHLTVETQSHEDACGLACVVMLLWDRGLHVGQAQLLSETPFPSTAEDLVAQLEKHSALAWTGGALPGPPLVTWELLNYITEERGTWAALMEPGGPTSIGHWVVVDGVSADGHVLIRDPAGLAYTMLLGDFVGLWQYTVLVMQEEVP